MPEFLYEKTQQEYDTMKEVIRKLCLVANWGVLGGSGLLFTIFSFFDDQKMIFLGIGLLITAFIIHHIINWVFK